MVFADKRKDIKVHKELISLEFLSTLLFDIC